MSGILSNAISGLQASQVALRTAGNNISNANTAGYSRQQVDFSTRESQKMGGAGYLGNGVNSNTVARVVDDFVTTQMRLDTSAFNQLDKYNTKIGTVDKLFSDISTGLVGGFQSFFSALQNGVSDPSSTPARQLIITQADSLSQRYNMLYDRLNDVERSVNSEVKTVTSQINAIAKSIADLNQSIANKNSSGTGAQPNDLLDQREEALRKLSELISVQVVRQDDGDINIFVGTGEPVVIGSKNSSLSVSSDGKIFVGDGTRAADITSQVSGGQLGGLLKFKNEVLEPSFNEMGRIAIVMSDAFNKVQTQGLDLNGNYGQSMFTDINEKNITYSRILHGSNNALPDDRQISLSIVDASALTISDYKFQITPGTTSYNITRLSDNSVVGQGTLTGAYPTEIEFDGVKLTLEGGSFQGGDTFTLQPTRTGARDIKSLLTQPESIAFASPIRTGSAIGNTGKGVVSAGEVLGMTDANNNLLSTFANAGKLSPPVIIRFTSDTTYEVLDNTDPANPKPLNPAIREQTFYPNRDNAIFTTDKGETRVIGNGAALGLPAGRTALSPVYAKPLTPPIPANTLAQPNNYPPEFYTFTFADKTTGLTTSKSMVTSPNASAAQTAAQLNTIPGVTAHAFTTATITDINIDPAAFAAASATPPTAPLQLSINGENIIPYANGVMDSKIPDPNISESDFNTYLAAQINSNTNLKTLGIRAEASSNSVTGAPEIHLVAASGVDLDIRFSASSATNNNISVNDSSGNPNVRLYGVDDGNIANGVEQSAVTVGGKIDITMSDGVSLSTSPKTSQLLGDSTAPGFATSSYTGYQVSISGTPKAGDVFTVGFNSDSKNDNRNGLLMSALETASTMEGGMSFGQAYGRLVEDIGTKSNLSQINTDAAKSLLEQTKSMRDSVSGVNLDEEAANLILFQQMYTANARVISISKDLFDTLLSSIGR